MLFLTATTETFTLVTNAALSTDWSVGYVDMDTTVGATAGSAQGNVSTATTTTIVAAPAANVQRQLKSFTVVNKDATSTQTVTLNKVTGAGTFALGAARTVALAPGESLTYIDSVGFASFDSVGRLKVTNFGGIGASSAVFARGDFTWSSTLVGPMTANSFIPASATVPTNGVYLPAANSVGISSNTTERVRIDSSGNVGIGTATIGTRLVIAKSDTNTTFSSEAGTTQIQNTSITASNYAGLMFMEGNGNYATYVGTQILAHSISSTGVIGELVFATKKSGVGGNPVERLRIDSSGQLIIQTVGTGISIKEGSNAKMGTATLSAGTVVVSTTAVTSTSRIFLTVQSLGTVAVATPVAVTARSAGTSFTISSSAPTDTSVVAWMLVEPS